MAIGDLVATLSIPGVPGASFQLVNNPEDLFSISGSQLLSAVGSFAVGSYPVTVEAQFSNQVLTLDFNMIQTIEIDLDPAPGWTIVG